MRTLVAELKSTSKGKDGPGSFEAILSVPSLDRDDEVIDAKAFEPLPDHIPIDLDHKMDVENTIGSGRPFYDGDALKLAGTFASTPKAQMVRTLVDEGHIRSMSVAFMPGGEWEIDEKDGKNHLRKGELLNAGIVAIASNRDALITASKSLVRTVVEVADAIGDTTNKGGARNSTADLTLIQTAHDALASLGAACEAKASAEADDTTTEKAAEAADTKSPVLQVASLLAHVEADLALD